LKKYAAKELSSAKAKVAAADASADQGKLTESSALYQEAVQSLKQASNTAKAREAWSEALLAADETFLNKYATKKFSTAKAKAAAADVSADQGKLTEAADLYREAVQVLKQAKYKVAPFVNARQAWSASFIAADDPFLNKYATKELSAAKAKASSAEANADQGKLTEAAALYREAVRVLKQAKDTVALFVNARQVWSASLIAADEPLLNKYVAKDLSAAKAKSSAAEANADQGKLTEAADLYREAVQALKQASSFASTKEAIAKATASAIPLIQQLEMAISKKNKLESEDILAQLDNLIPSDPRMIDLHSKVEALPIPKILVIDLGGGVKMDFVLIPAGEFVMGSPSGEGSDKEHPQHQVRISRPFYLGKYEVTQEQWHAVMGSNPSQLKDPRNPVENVSWNDCQEFLKKLNSSVKGRYFRLPTEAEWEYACRAGSTTAYYFGDSASELGNYAWYLENAEHKPHPVGQKKPNAWGLYDMHGNVCEWCSDWYGPYESGKQTDPVGLSSGYFRVLRGGSWDNGSPGTFRCAYLNGLVPVSRNDHSGFRVARTLIP
jgi:formylglycine-generating enzyme required for sulfatase activity